MKLHSNSRLQPGFVLLILCVSLAAACGGDANPMSPSIPQPLASATFGTSAISGQLVGGGSFGSSSLGAAPRASAMSGIQVAIEGTNKTTRTNGNGEFVLAGVPSGNVKLTIVGAGNNANVMVQGVGNNQVVQLTIQVQPGSATVVDERRNPLPEFTGIVVAIDPAALAFSLDGGSTILTDENTWWDTGGDLHSYADLQREFESGAVISVQGRWVNSVESVPLATVVVATVDSVDVEELRLAFNRDKWSLGWIDNGSSGNGSSAIEARITGGPFAQILPQSVEMKGPDYVVVPFATVFESGRFVAKFTKAQAISIATSVPAGSTVEVVVRGTLVDGTPWELTAIIEISDDDDDDDDDTEGKLDPVIAAHAIADIQVVIDYINSLVADGEMASNNAKPLITSLESAIGSLQKLNGTPSINKLESFLNKLESSEKAGKIPEEEADHIRDLVDDILVSLRGAV